MEIIHGNKRNVMKDFLVGFKDTERFIENILVILFFLHLGMIGIIDAPYFIV